MSNFLSLRKFVTPEFIFGLGSIDLAPRYIKNYSAKKVLIVTDPGVIAAGWVSRVTDNLEKNKIKFSIFSQITPNPKIHEVISGVNEYQKSGCDAIVAIGGGSVMDCAKGIGVVASNFSNLLDFEGIDNIYHPMPPLICIPTTAGTAADVSQFAIFTDENEKRKFALISKAVVPDVSLIDPETLTTMDPFLSACSGVDALVHAIEAFVSNASSPITDIHALEAIKLISQNLSKSIENPNDLELRSKVMLGSLEAGLAFSNASLGVNHSLAHSVGGLLDLAHGETNAILLRNVIDFNFSVAPDRFDKIGEAFNLNFSGLTSSERKKALLEYIEKLKLEVGIIDTLSKRGLKSSEISLLAKRALKDPCTITNPRRPNQRDLEVIYEESL